MINEPSPTNEAGRPTHGIHAESVLSYVVIGCFVVAVLGILQAFSGGGGMPLLASATSFGVIAYIYCHKS